MKMKKVCVALSGGVDSAVAARLLMEGDWDVSGVFMKLCGTKGLSSARAVAGILGIDFETVDFCRYFKKEVIDQFIRAYRRGLTPNPCVVCNRVVKFGQLLEYARRQGFHRLATGHYARVMSDGGVFRLLAGRDERKDQSYFLYRLDQDQLSRVVFPVGELTKKSVRVLAKRYHLPVYTRPESQDICFLRTGNYRDLVGKGKAGDVIALTGEVIGRHPGLGGYTIGQRRGFEILPAYRRQFSGRMPALVVIGKNVTQNKLMVATEREGMKDRFWVQNVHWVSGPPRERERTSLFIKIRSTGRKLSAEITEEGLKWRVALSRAQLGIAPGQHVVFYRRRAEGWEVVGGGEILATLDE